MDYQLIQRIGTIIWSVCNHRGLSVQDLSHLSDVPVSTLIDTEQGQPGMSALQLDRVANVLALNPVELGRGNEVAKTPERTCAEIAVEVCNSIKTVIPTLQTLLPIAVGNELEPQIAVLKNESGEDHCVVVIDPTGQIAKGQWRVVELKP